MARYRNYRVNLYMRISEDSGLPSEWDFEAVFGLTSRESITMLKCEEVEPDEPSDDEEGA